MSERITVQITAQDGATKTFVAVARSAQQMGDAIERAADEGSAGLDGLNKSAEQTGRSYEQLRDRTMAAGAAIGAMSSVFAQLGQAAYEQERQINVLNRMYGEHADRILEATDAIQDYSTFSNESARQAATTLNTLTQNYDLSIDQLESLLTLSADLAAAHGRTIEETSQMIQNALRGEGEYIEAVGVTLNDNYVAAEAARRGIEGWTTTMTDAEKAAFRYVLLMEQTATVQGFAGEQAESAAGQTRQFVNSLQDIAATAGAVLGPLGQSASVLADYSIQIIALTSVAGRAAPALIRLGRAIADLSIAGVGLGSVLGPAGLVAAAGVGAYALYQWAQDGDLAKASAQDATEAIENLQQSLATVAVRSGNTDYISQLSADLQDVLNQAVNVQEQINLIQAETAQNQGALFTDERLGPLYVELERVQFSEDSLEQLETDLTNIINYAFLQNGANAENVIAELERLNNEFLSGRLTAEEYAEGINALSTSMETFGIVTIDAAGNIVISAGQMEEAIEDVMSAMELYDQSLAASATSQQSQAQIIGNMVDAQIAAYLRLNETYRLTAEERRLVDRALEESGLTGATRDEAEANLDAAEAAEAYAAALEGQEAAARTMIRGREQDAYYAQKQLEAQQAQEEHAAAAAAAQEQRSERRQLDAEAERAAEEALATARREATEAARDSIMPAPEGFRGLESTVDYLRLLKEQGEISGETMGLVQDGLLGIQLSGASTLEVLIAMNQAWYDGNMASFEMAAGIENATGALQRLNDVVIGTTRNLSSTIQETADLVDELFGGDPYDGAGPLVDMLNDGRISQEQYNDTVEAGLGILEDNERAQRAIQEVQADQVPLLEAQTDAYADMMEELAELPALEQRRALALMDTATQADLARLATLAYSASIGEIPPELATDIIVSAAQADPILADLLMQYGLIEEGADGELRVVFPNGESLTGTIQDLTASIDALTLALGGVPPAAQEAETALSDLSEVEIRPPSSGGGASMPTTISDYAVYNPGVAPEEMPAGTGPAYQYVPAPLVPHPSYSGLVVPEPIATAFPEGNVVTYRVDLNIDDAGLEQQVRDIDGELSVWTADGYEVYLGADPEEALRAIDDVQGGVYVVDHTTGEVTFIANAENYDQERDRIEEETADLDKLRATIDVEGNPEDWYTEAHQSERERDALDGTKALITVLGDNDSALGSIDDAAKSRTAIDGTSALIAIDGDNSGYFNALANLPPDGSVVKTLWVSLETANNTGFNASAVFRHGGVAGYAHGGVIAELAEAGPELLHFAHGGTAIAGQRGLYSVPVGTYVSPANGSIPTMAPAAPIIININGPVFGLEDLDRHIADTIALAADQIWLSSGVVEGDR